MADDMKEDISALMDGAVAPEEMQGLIRSFRDDPESKKCWENYHLIGDAMRNNLPDKIDPNFSQRVCAAVAAENIPERPSADAAAQRTAKHHSFSARPAAGFAVAASVAAVAYLGFGMIAVDDPVGGSRMAANTAAPAFVAAMPAKQDLTRVQGSNWNVAKPSVESRLNNYFYNHQNVSSQSNFNARMLPSARIVTHVSGRQN